MRKVALGFLLGINLLYMGEICAKETASAGPGGLSITAFDRLAKTTVFGGYFDTEWKSSEKENSFIAHRLVLQTSSQPHEAILFNTELEYEYGGAVNTLDKSGEIKLEQAWVEYRVSDQFAWRTGIVLVPFGRLNFLHDSDVRDTTNRPIIHKYIIPTTWSDAGVGFRGNSELLGMDVNYEAYLLNGLTTTPSLTTGARNARPGFKTDNNGNKAFSTRIGFTPSAKSEYGFSYYLNQVKGSLVQSSMQMIGFDFLHKIEAFEMAAEVALADYEIDSPVQQDGYMVELRYHWLPSWIASFIGANQFESPSMTWFFRVGQVDLNREGTVSKSQSQTTLGVNYRPILSLVFKVEYEINRGNLSEGNYDTIWSSVAFGF